MKILWGLGWEAMLPSHAANSDNTSVHVARGQLVQESDVVGEVGRLSHCSGKGVRMPPPSEHSGEVVEWVGTLGWASG